MPDGQDIKVNFPPNLHEKKKVCGQPLTRDSSPMQGQAFEVSISRIYSVLLAEFGGKGDR